MNTHHRTLLPILLAGWLAGCTPPADAPPESAEPALAATNPAMVLKADEAAERARTDYGDAMVDTLAELMKFKTVHQDGLPNAENPEFQAMTAFLAAKAAELGFEFEDHGANVVVSLGDAEERLGLVTHGDVQPADPTKWAADPFSLDADSEIGLFVGRGVEDDKGPIAAALYAMKALQDTGLPLKRRVELVVSYTEESDWGPFMEFLQKRPPAELNIALDAEYPVVTAEKGWCSVFLSLAATDEPQSDQGDQGDEPWLASFTGGAFLSQVPEDARAVVARPDADVEAALLAAAEGVEGVDFTMSRTDEGLVVEARGVSAHSSKPWEGKNGITHLAQVLGNVDWPDSQAARMVRLVNDLVGTGHYAEKFGSVGYEHPFMGRLSLSLNTLQVNDSGALVAGINLRRPAGRGKDDVEASIHAAVDAWKVESGVDVAVQADIYEPYMVENAVHVDVLLGVFRRRTGQQDAGPIAIGGGTHARLVPNGVSFGPAMPGETYTGHSEHEYIRREQLLLNLEMYTAMLVELAARPAE